MLGFIQRYQKIVFAIVAVLISISFLFFGILPKGGGGNQVDRTVYRTLSKEKIKQSKYEGIKMMLQTQNGDEVIYGKALGSHFFPDSFFVTDIVRPGILSLVAKKHAEALKANLAQKHELEKNYKTYSHPEAQFLNADSIWSIHAPNLKVKLDELKAETDPIKAFEIKEALYLEETQFTPFTLWQVLSDQQEHFNWITKDPSLNPERVELFGYHTLEDWFGDDTLKKTIEFIFEVNSLAKANGYRITMEEAERDLLAQNEQSYARLKSLGIKDIDSASAYFDMKLARLGMNKVQMVSLWKELLTFRRYFEEASMSAIIDNKTLHAFETHASEKKYIKNFSVPQELAFSSMKELMQFEVYMQALGKPFNQLSLSYKPKKLEEIEKQYPGLVEQPLHLSFRETSTRRAALEIKVQEIWKYKLDPKHFETLSKKFPQIASFDPVNFEDYQDKMEQLPLAISAQMDYFIKEQLLQTREDWKKQALSYAELQSGDLCVRKNGQGLPFVGLEMSENKESFLNDLFLGKVSGIFTFDNEHFYEVESVELSDSPRLVAYQTLKNERVLEKMLYKKIKSSQEEAVDIEKLSPTAQKKLVDEYAIGLKKAILNDYLSEHKEPKHKVDENFYCAYRLYKPMREALSYLKDHAKDENSFKFNDLWTLEGRPKMCTRYLSDESEIKHYLPLKEGQWSEVDITQDTLSFAHILPAPKHHAEHPMQQQMKHKIGAELKKVLAEEILNDILPESTR